MDTQDTSLIRTAALSIGYRTKKHTNCLASDLDIGVAAGQLISVLGQNGIGKSTLLRTLTRVQPALSGQIFLQGQAIEQLNRSDLSQHLSLVLSENLPESNLSVFELVALGRQPYTNWLGTLTDKDLKAVYRSLEQTQTQHLAKMPARELSDGQRQKVLISRALAQDTPIIVLDEPTSHLDLHHTIHIFSLLKELATNHQKTIIVSTHEVNLALSLADQLWLMSPGSFIAGKTTDLIDSEALDRLFDSDLIHFDKAQKQFNIQQTH
ncbi:MAG: ABC transporter ATP-binding protein [Lutibacter sp.]|nr:ABC transporter ATP-binding protein [Lutibacter sp.]